MGGSDEWQSTHPPYELIPHSNLTPVHTRVDQLNPNDGEW